MFFSCVIFVLLLRMPHVNHELPILPGQTSYLPFSHVFTCNSGVRVAHFVKLHVLTFSVLLQFPRINNVQFLTSICLVGGLSFIYVI